MNYRNKLMSLSLIALAVFSACTNEMENGTHPGKGDQRLSFAVSMGGTNAWKPTAGTRAASDLGESTYELEPVEMEGKVNGKTVYLTAEVTDGFPGDNRMMTRGTQVTEDNKTKDRIMETFAVSAYTDIKGTPDFMYNVPTTKGSPENGTTYWYPEEKFYWPGVKSLNFYAWYPHTANAEGLTVSGADENGTPKLHYTAPEDVKKQMDVMTAVATNQAEQEAIPLTFDHALSAVKFVAGSDLPNCVVKSVKLYNLQYEGTYDIASSTWAEVKSDKKDFTVSWGYNAVEGTEGSPVTREDETFFLVPQALDGAKVEVTFMNTDNTEFTVGAALTGTWEKGKTYIYKISHNFVYLGVSNEKFIAYVDKTDEMKDQVAFYITFSSSDPNDTRMILSVEDFEQNSGISVTPKTITPGSNIPIKISWDGKQNWLYTSVVIAKSLADYQAGKEDKQVWIVRPNMEESRVDGETNIFEKDGAFWVYSVPETTSQPFKDEYSDGDIIEVQTESDWLAITPSPTYNKNTKYQAIYNNASKGDFYLQTLSIPSENRFASLLACKEDMSKNIMYCVEQKAFTADFGFKDCERNISRESEKWNIVLNGGHFKEDVTNLKARVVISSDVPDTQITDLGRDLTCGDPVAISVDKATSTGVSATPYVKKRWDNLQNNTANNGTRKVNVQVKNDNLDEWYDCGPDGLMSDRFTWGNNFAIGYNQYHGHGNNWDNGALPIVRDYYEVHQKHPMFGLHRWSIIRDNADANIMGNALYMIFCSARQWNGWNNRSIYRNSMSGEWSYIACNQANCITDPENPNYNDVYNGGRFITIGVNGRNWRWSSWQNYLGPLTVWIPVVYTDSHCGLNARPTDDTPIPGTSVNE
ncbi:fimbrillin family protein [Phocaeicola vulgatus]|uniref:fimbrillin family protein n=1 Tax=Phocaeicola vulgatus TaxID=821 RepID=UPI0022E6AB83|nr:fimbrillin family protein [Phocaeicola vulgatus]